MKDLTIIVPLVEYVDEMKEMFDISLNSILTTDMKDESSIIFIGPKSSLDVLEDYSWGDREILFIENEKNIEPQFQINKAIKDVKTAYFTVLEFDDKFNDFWFNEVEKYIKHYPDVSIFLPLIEVYDFKRPELGAVAYANEPVWASSFSEELGFLDVESLKNHYNFIVSGAIIKKSDYIYAGGIKTSLKYFFWYEFLLRLCHNGKRAFVIPKVGYEHFVNRDNSMTSIIQNKDNEEIDFWFTTAQEEYPYKNDRKKTYNS